jgi:hypothetical protein
MEVSCNKMTMQNNVELTSSRETPLIFGIWPFNIIFHMEDSLFLISLAPPIDMKPGL